MHPAAAAPVAKPVRKPGLGEVGVDGIDGVDGVSGVGGVGGVDGVDGTEGVESYQMLEYVAREPRCWSAEAVSPSPRPCDCRLLPSP